MHNNDMMKRFLKYVPIVILALASSSRETLPEAKTTENDDHCIVLTFGNVHPALETKASVRGDTLYNESAVRRVDCFFYPTGATGSNAVFSAIGRGAEVVKVQQDSLEYKVKIFSTDDDAVAMFGSATSGQCEVYVICNAPLSYGSNTSVPALKELVLEHDFSAQVVMGSFAMHSNAPETVELTTENEVSTATGRVHVSRSAAKIQLFMQIPERMWDEENKKYWYPRVPKEKIEELMAAPSKGEYFMQNIHDQYSVNYQLHGNHNPENTKTSNRHINNYYKKMRKNYEKGMKNGTMKGVLSE